MLLAGVAPGDLRRSAQQAERLGFDEIWVSEDYFESAAYAAAAIVLSETERIPVGIGVASLLTRHPAATAMEIATLGHAYPGRLTPGLGLGLPASLRAMGLMPPAPVAEARDSFLAVRSLLFGDQAPTTARSFVEDGVVLAHPLGREQPLFMGALGPRMLELAGEVADGVVTSVLAAPAYLQDCQERIAVGARRADRLVPSIASFAWYCVDDDGDAARTVMRSVVASTLGVLGPLPLTDAYGVSSELTDMISAGGVAEVQRRMPDQWVDDLTITGTASECADAIRRFEGMGVDSLVLCPVPASRLNEMLDATAAQVFPLLKGGGDGHA